jgi:beta-phosphoglucomutase
MGNVEKGQIAPVRGMAFDLEGTIVDLEAAHHAAHLRAAADVGLNMSWDEALERLPHCVGGPDEEVAAEMASLVDGEVSPQQILSAKRMHFEELLRDNGRIAPREGFTDFTGWVKNLGIKMAIGTATSRILALRLIKEAGLLSDFNEAIIVAREDVSAPKPSPDTYCETARRIGIPPSSQLVFEDSPIGLISARSAGCRLVALPTVQRPSFVERLRREGAEAVFMRWSDPALRSFVIGVVRAG